MADCRENEPNWYYALHNMVNVVMRRVNIRSECTEMMRLINLQMLSNEPLETVFPQGGLDLDNYYSIVFYGRTNMNVYNVPLELNGIMQPEGFDPQPVTFYRDPRLDRDNCEFNTSLTDYAYVSDRAYRPRDLWGSNVDWHQQCKWLSCKIPQSYTDDPADTLSGKFWVVGDMYLDCLNDTTACFVPANGENIDFDFRYSTITGLSLFSIVNFKVADNQENEVYSERIYLVNDPEYPGNGLPLRYDVYISWDGRKSDGHLADPENGPYHAWVETDMDPGPLLNSNLSTNIEDFFIAPKIDEIIITHEPSFPPPGPGQNTTVYAIIKGKVDDSIGPWTENYRYYRGPDIWPDEITIWDGHLYHFNDLETGDENDERQQYYFEANNAQTIPLIEWNTYCWGPLRYTWYVYHDWRFRIGGENQIAYEKIDTSFFENGWGYNWKTDISTPRNWFLADDKPYMRLLVGAGISDTRNSFLVQDEIAKENENAHKVIFSGCNKDINDYDIVDWAITHIGVAYQLHNGFTKNPYRRIECSGLVTATRIQEIGPDNNQVYRIGHIEADEWDEGQYNFHLNDIQLGVEEINPEQVGRGSLITFRERLSNGQLGGVSHIAIVEDAWYNRRTHSFEFCHMINARGWPHDRADIKYGRVRYEDLMADFRSGWSFRFFNFSQ